MLLKTNGIVLKAIQYSETSIIATILTEEFGVKSYIVNGVRKKKSKYPQSLFMPLSLVEVISNEGIPNKLQRISDIRHLYCYQSIPFEIHKSSIVFFLNEIILKCCTHQETDTVLFQFIEKSLIFLDNYIGTLKNFHLVFLVKLSQFLGFYPNINSSNEAEYFDLINGIFTKNRPVHVHYISKPHSEHLLELTQVDFLGLDKLNFALADRRVLLQSLIKYYQIHIDSFGNIKSLEILEEVLG
jgi:DNA repair protein RecO (recombination protein O)